MRTVVWFVYFFLSLFVLFPLELYVALSVKLGREKAVHGIVNGLVRGWMRSLLWLAGVKVVVTGKENIPAGSKVFIANHQGYFDIPSLLVGLDEAHGFIAKVELKKLPFVRKWMEFIHCIFIDRSSNRSAIHTLGEAVQTVKNGHSIIVFPEGTRSRDGVVKEFKPGAITIAKKAGAPVVPLCIEGSYKAMEANGMKIKPAVIHVQVLPPVDLNQYSREEQKGMHEKLRQDIIAAMALVRAYEDVKK